MANRFFRQPSNCCTAPDMRRVAPVRDSRTDVALLPWVFLAPAGTETKMDLTGKPPYRRKSAFTKTGCATSAA